VCVCVCVTVCVFVRARACINDIVYIKAGGMCL
jgi:hypothetical protein